MAFMSGVSLGSPFGVIGLIECMVVLFLTFTTVGVALRSFKIVATGT